MKISISKFQKSQRSFVRTVAKEFSRNLKTFGSNLLKELHFEILPPIVSHVNENEKNSLTFQFSKFQKSQPYCCEDHWEENSEKVSKLSPAICRRSSVLK